METKIIHYNHFYATPIKQMLIREWGDWDDENMEEFAKQEAVIMLVALVNNKFTGTCYGKMNKSGFLINVICIKPEYQQKGIGEKLLARIIKEAQTKFNVKIFYSYLNERVTDSQPFTNSQRLFKQFGFKLIKKRQSYWGKQYPKCYCSLCNQSPCICNALEVKLIL